MKFAVLRSIGHNIADSLASGVGLLIGMYELDIFGEALRCPERCITVDFLSGKVASGRASPTLSRAIERYASVLADFCRKHGASASDFRVLTACYWCDWFGPHFVVTIENQQGRRAVDEYIGSPGRRILILDHLGRIRRKRNRASLGLPTSSRA
jgi:hypothetical protein